MTRGQRFGLGMMLTSIWIVLMSMATTAQGSPVAFQINEGIALIVAFLFVLGVAAFVLD